VTDRDVMEYDVVVVGAGPAGLATAIRYKELAPDRSVCVLEKASTVGAQLISGCALEPGPLDALLPGWRETPPDICVTASRDEFWYLTKTGGMRLPTPPQMHNRGNLIVSLGQLAPLLAARAESLGVDVFAGFAAAEAIFGDGGRVAGVRIGDMGLDRERKPGPNHAPGADIRAGTTVLAEGARGSVTKQLVARLGLGDGRQPQTYALGIKELWQLPAGRAEPGLIQHSVGWPVDSRTYGGSFLYHLDRDRVTSATSPGSTTRTRASGRSRRSSSSSTIRAFMRCWKAARSSPTERARSPRAAGNRCRAWMHRGC
jgi:electron-transferring-flavoprotein dehydrogenase